jgi:hypothetical protein
VRRINIYIGDLQHEQFQVLAERHGRPYSELIREALNEYLKHQDLQGQATKPYRPRARRTKKRN